MDFEGFGIPRNPHLQNIVTIATYCISIHNDTLGLSRDVAAKTQNPGGRFLRIRADDFSESGRMILLIPNKISNWPQLCNEIDAVIQSDDGRRGCLEIELGMSQVEICTRWSFR